MYVQYNTTRDDDCSLGFKGATTSLTRSAELSPLRTIFFHCARNVRSIIKWNTWMRHDIFHKIVDTLLRNYLAVFEPAVLWKLVF